MPNGRRARVAGVVIVRQRPGTAKGFVFITLEDETGFANAIVTPNRFERHRRTIVGANALVIEGVVQNQQGVVSIKADHFEPLLTAAPRRSTSHTTFTDRGRRPPARRPALDGSSLLPAECPDREQRRVRRPCPCSSSCSREADRDGVELRSWGPTSRAGDALAPSP